MEKIPKKQAFAKFFDVFAKFFDVFGPVRTCFYAFGYIRIHSDAFGKKKSSNKKLKKKRKSKKIATFFDVFGRFWGSWRQMDLKISSGIKFCSRYTCPEVCAIRNREKKASCPASASPIATSGAWFGPGLSVLAIRGGGVAYFL